VSDFAQSGSISTLQQLNEPHLARLEAELPALVATTPLTIVLPCHVADLQQPAMARILDELAGAAFVREVVVSANGLDSRGGKAARRMLAALPYAHRILRTDTPRLRRILSRAGIHAPPGKGLNTWLACGLVWMEKRSQFIVTQDCDVSSFRRTNLARLCFAAAHPALSYHFCKMYYSRVSDRLYGRVTRLFLAPLLQALVRVVGRHPLLDFLCSFRYPLAGECCMTRDLAGALPMDSGWGLELTLLAEVFRRDEPRHIAQVDGGGDYDHRHHPFGDESGGLFPMCKAIAQTLLACLVEEGLPVCAQFVDAVQSSFARELHEAARRSLHLALINGLQTDAGESEMLAIFSRAFSDAAVEFLSGDASSVLPAWSELAARDNRAAEEIVAAAQYEPGK